ncbi:MAG: prolipoprotein diacylglyceryl transferase [Aureispira sp.]|nr:prolipoprotein diacylglyceryl transferase [Aureispira sp.]
MDYIVWDPSPYIVEVGGFALRWYSTFFAAGFVVGYFILRKFLLEEKVPLKVLDQLLMYSVIGAILGARIGNCVFYDWDYFSTRPLEIILPFTFTPEFQFTGYRGLASHGGMLGLALAYWILSWRTGKPYLWFMDKLAVVGVLGVGFIRLGNLMNSEVLGNETSVSWAFVFLQRDLIPRHPVQIYSFICYFSLFVFMYWFYRKNFGKRADGYIAGVSLALLCTVRFLLEFLKEHYVFDPSSPFNMAQYLSIPFIILGIYFARKKSPLL